jgi:hypothetical protein
MKTKIWLPVLLVFGMMLTVLGNASAATTGKTPAKKGAQPWMVALVENETKNAYEGQFCGGSLIAPEWVLTAAHCLEGAEARDVDVVIGRYQLSTNEGERITAAELAIHTGYPDDRDGQDNDIALIRLSRPATKGTPIALITAATEYTDDPGTLARLTGWGVMSENSDESPDILHGVDVPIVTQASCKVVYGSDLMPDDLCAGREEGGADSCYGDSGGPLWSYDRNGSPIQIGIVSWGDECGAAGNYGVYARLTTYESWINGVMAGKVETLQPSDLPEDFGADEWGESNWDEEDWDDSDWETSEPSNAILELSDIVLPNGFDLVWAEESRSELYVSYENERGDYVDIFAETDEWDFSEDRPTRVNGVEVLFYQEDGEQIALFNQDGNGVEVYGTISRGQMRQLISSLLP